MSVLPLILNDTLNSVRSTRILDQHFGVGLDLDDFLAPINFGLLRCPASYYKPWCSVDAHSNSSSTIVADKDKFQVNLDVKQFKPKEVTVMVSDKNTITIEGKHEEKQDEHGFVSRQFIRKYVLADSHDTDNVVSNLSSDGVLSVTASRLDKVVEEGERVIPIQQTGIASKTMENKEEREKNQFQF